MQKRAIKTKHKILNTATEEFSQNGLHGTRVDVIAEKAHVGKWVKSFTAKTQSSQRNLYFFSSATSTSLQLFFS